MNSLIIEDCTTLKLKNSLLVQDMKKCEIKITDKYGKEFVIKNVLSVLITGDIHAA